MGKVAIVTLFNTAYQNKMRLRSAYNKLAIVKQDSSLRELKNEHLTRDYVRHASKTFGGVFANTQDAVGYAKCNPNRMDDLGHYNLLTIEEICLGGSVIPELETIVWMRLKNGVFKITKQPKWSEGIFSFFG